MMSPGPVLVKLLVWVLGVPEPAADEEPEESLVALELPEDELPVDDDVPEPEVPGAVAPLLVELPEEPPVELLELPPGWDPSVAEPDMVVSLFLVCARS